MSVEAFVKPIILVDADNVLYHWEKQYIADRLALDPNSTSVIPFGQRTGFESIDKNSAEAELSNKVKTRPGFYWDLQPVEGAFEALEAMEAAGFLVYICTAPDLLNPTCASDKLAAITRDFGRKWAERTIITGDKTMVHGTILIDDKPEITGAVTPTWQHVIFDQSYNRHVTDKVRLNGWSGWEETLLFLLLGS